MINATLLLEDLDLILEGLSGSNFSVTIVSLISIFSFTILGSDLLPHWSIASIDICLSTGE